MSSCPIPIARVDVMYRMLPYLPLFLALSTSSPFWQSRRTGLKGYRLAAYDELPRTGVPELFRTKEEFDAYVAALVRAGVMEDSSYVWWAIRPSLKHPTLELRAPDCCTLLDDSLAIAALYRTLARHLYNNPWRNADMNAVSRAIVVENKWRAQRYGVHGTFVAEEGAVTVAEMLDRVIEETAADADALGCTHRDQALPGDRGGRHLGRRAACGLRGASQGRQPRQRVARRHRLDRQRDVAIARSLSTSACSVGVRIRVCTTSPRARASTTPSARKRKQRERLHRGAPFRRIVAALRRQRPDQAFDQRADQRRRGGCRILIRQMAAGERGADARLERAGQRLAIFHPGVIHVAVDRLGDQRESEPPVGERAHAEGRDRGRQRRQRSRRRVRGLRQRRDLGLRQRRDQLGHQLGLGREVAVDRAGRDAGALGHRRDLHRRDAALRRQRARRRQDRVVPRGELASDVVGAPVGHDKE